MTVKELIGQLKKENQDLLVVLQKDSEGNGYSPYYDAWAGVYFAESGCSGYAKSEDELSEEYDDETWDGEKALFLTPTN